MVRKTSQYWIINLCGRPVSTGLFTWHRRPVSTGLSTWHGRPVSTGLTTWQERPVSTGLSTRQGRPISAILLSTWHRRPVSNGLRTRHARPVNTGLTTWHGRSITTGLSLNTNTWVVANSWKLGVLTRWVNKEKNYVYHIYIYADCKPIKESMPFLLGWFLYRIYTN